MAKNFKLKLVNNPSAVVEKALREGFALGLKDLNVWITTQLVPALVFGGLGLQGIAQTEFYKWISSDDGLSQLGIPPTEPPKLLQAYESSFKVSSSNNTLIFHFGDVAELKIATVHPATGTGKLKIDSWLNWILDPTQKVTDAGYVPRTDIPPGLQRFIRLKDPLGGLMLPKDKLGSMGNWEFPSKFQNYDVDWLKVNQEKIIGRISRQLARFIHNRLR